MYKKVIPIVISLCLLFSISVMAENTSAVTDGSVSESSQQMPQGERPQGGRGSMGMPPSDDMQGRTPPNMPNGEMPQGEFTPHEEFTPPNGEFAPQQNAEEFTPPQGDFNPVQGNVENNTETTPQADDNKSAQKPQFNENNQQSGAQAPESMGGFPANMQNFNTQTQDDAPKSFLDFVKAYSTPITSVVLLGLAFVFVIFYRRKNY